MSTDIVEKILYELFDAMEEEIDSGEFVAKIVSELVEDTLEQEVDIGECVSIEITQIPVETER